MEEESYNLELCLAIGGGGLMPAEKLDDDCEEEEEEEEEEDKEKRSTREEEHHKKLRCVVSEEEGGNVNEGVRKKLKLDMEQLTLLEDTFRAHGHSMLSLRKKEGLAKRLNLKTRQVEVWFQNRRARTKREEKKKDSEMLRRSCERLSSENQRLKMELQEMKSLKLTFLKCLSCEMIFKTTSSMANEKYN